MKSSTVAVFAILKWMQILDQGHPVIAFTVGLTSRDLSRCTPSAVGISHTRLSSTQLTLFRRLFARKNKKSTPGKNKDDVALITTDNIKSEDQVVGASAEEEVVDVCVIGGGVSGLVAATEAKKTMKGNKDFKVVLLEGSNTLGGRVQSDTTKDGFVLDRGFAVFIEEYPFAKSLLDYGDLQLGSFLPGALVKVKGQKALARVADPFRRPEDIFEAAFSSVGSFWDKLALLPLIFHAKSTSIDELFQERETDTLTCLKERWGLGDDIVDSFFKPFLEGIFLAPLEEQSSRLFMFIFKMFSEGAATLPKNGIRAISLQLARKAEEAGVSLRTDHAVELLAECEDGFRLKCKGQTKYFKARSVVVATDGVVAQRLLSQVKGFESLAVLPEQKQRSVGCLYYAFQGQPPVNEPILILNGVKDERGTKDYPINNMCFPSVVNQCYAPEGYGLCSITVLEDVMELYVGRDNELDIAVRKQLGTWFPDYKTDIEKSWELKNIYFIKNAQPSHLKGPMPANVNGVRDNNSFRGKKLPEKLYVCGDHMATATLNGALQSGVNAGKTASQSVRKPVATSVN